MFSDMGQNFDLTQLLKADYSSALSGGFDHFTQNLLGVLLDVNNKQEGRDIHSAFANLGDVGYGDYLSYVLNSGELIKVTKGSGSSFTGSGVNEEDSLFGSTGTDNTQPKPTKVTGSGDEGTTVVGTSPESATLSDIYSLLANDFPTTVWPTMARIADGGNTVLLGSADITAGLVGSVAAMSMYVQEIFTILDSHLNSGRSGESVKANVSGL